MVKSEQILAVATREIGYHEGPNKHNKFGEWYGMNGVAWCMEFVQWVYHQCGADLPLKTASCGGLLRWYQRNAPECITNNPVAGAIVIFDFIGTGSTTDHTGLFVKKTDLKVTTIDGNTSSTSEGNGGWVQQKTRSITYCNPTYIVPRELEDEMNIDKFISEITPEQLDQLAAKMTNETAYMLHLKSNEYAATLNTPDWMQPELDEAVAAGITDGSRPLATCMRGQAAIMALRAVKK